MGRDDVLQRLRKSEPDLRALGVSALYLFGSHGRDDAKLVSDVDVFIDPLPGQTLGFLPFMRARAAIQDALGDDVALGYSTRAGLSPYIREQVSKEAVRVF